MTGEMVPAEDVPVVTFIYEAGVVHVVVEVAGRRIQLRAVSPVETRFDPLATYPAIVAKLRSEINELRRAIEAFEKGQS